MKESGSHMTKGFSVIEILVVLGIIFILAALTIPNFRSTSAFNRLRNSAYNLANQIEQARFRSVSELNPHRVVIDPANNRWSLERRIDRTNPASGYTTVSIGALENGVRYGFGSISNTPSPMEQCGTTSCAPVLSTFIAFNSRGFPIDATGVPRPRNTVYLMNGQDTFAITVSLAGSVELWRFTNGSWQHSR